MLSEAASPKKNSELVLYAIAPEGAALASLPLGLRGLGLRVLCESGLLAVVSAAPDRQLLTRPQTSDVLEFQKAVAAIAADCDVLPARFGCVLAGEAELLAHLGALAPEYQEGLRRVAGCTELGIHIELPEEAEAAAPPAPSQRAESQGAGYLRARQAYYGRLTQTESRLAAAAQEVQAGFASLCKESYVLPPASAGASRPARSVAFLVFRQSVSQFRAHMDIYKSSAAARLTLLGPWPPYSFTPQPEAERRALKTQVR